MARPPVLYARTRDDVTIAYSVVGEGPTTIVQISPFISQLEVAWEQPAFETFVSRLAAGARVVLLDRRGTGLSDHTTASGERLDLPQLAADVEAVLDASGTDRAVLLGASLGSMIAIQFAAELPDRCAALVLVAGAARHVRTAGFDLGVDPATFDAQVDTASRAWGTGASFLEDLGPAERNSILGDWAARLERHTCSPGMVAAILRRFATYDVRALLGTLSLPTLVVHRTDDAVADVEHGRFLSAHIPGATFVELPGHEHLFFLGDQAAMLDTIRSFIDRCVTGSELAVAARRAERRNAYGNGWGALTGPEREVGALIASGMTNREVAERLRMSPHTVDGRLRRIFAKLSVSTRVELTAEYTRIVR